jgi:hypothetical protein
MKVAVIGSRSFANYEQMARELDALAVAEGSPITLISSGGAAGADEMAMCYAKERGIPTLVYLPDYKTYGRKAPLLRNKDVVAAADVVLAVWDGVSRGTAHAVREARKLRIRTIVVVPELP